MNTHTLPRWLMMGGVLAGGLIAATAAAIASTGQHTDPQHVDRQQAGLGTISSLAAMTNLTRTVGDGGVWECGPQQRFFGEKKK